MFSLSEVANKFDYGMGAATIEYDGEHKYIRITDIDENTHKYNGTTPVSPSGSIDSQYLVQKNDILFARTGASVGKTYLYDESDGLLYFAGFLIRANVNSENNSHFVYTQTLTERYKKWVLATSMRSGQPGINSQEYATFKFFAPTKKEQEKIANFLKVLDKKIEKQSILIENLKLYKRGVLQRLFNTQIKMTIVQPRLDSISEWEISVDDLQEWAENTLRPVAELAAKGEGKFNAGEHCRFCKLKATCRKRAEKMLEIAKYDFAPPAELSDEEIAEVLMIASELAKWADDVFAYAQAKAVNEGKKWDGFKVVEGRSNRKYADETKVAEVCRENGYALSQIFKSTLIGITDMEKLMGKKQFKELLGEYVHKPKGKLTLVPVSDKREEISTINEFMED